MVLGKFGILGAPIDEDGAPPARRTTQYPSPSPNCSKTTGARYGEQDRVPAEGARRSGSACRTSTYYKRSYDLAAGLVALGVQPGDRVALIAENSIEWVCSYYAIVVAGAIAVPIYYDLKPAEIAGDGPAHARPRWSFASPKALPKLADADIARVRKLIVVGDAEPREGVPSGFLRRPQPEIVRYADVAARGTPDSRQKVGAIIVEPDDLASIVFTSGTTGGIKGVMLTHRNFMANLPAGRRSSRSTNATAW